MPVGERRWRLAASSFNWTREILRARRTPFDIVTMSVAGTSTLLEIELGQCFRSFPSMNVDEVERMRSGLERRGARVSIVGLGLDTHVSLEERRSGSERLAFLEPQIRAAALLGAEGVRLPFGQPDAQLLSALCPLLDDVGLVLYLEVQGPQDPFAPMHAASMSALADPARPLRLLLDASMITPALPVTYLEQLRRSGVPPGLVARVTHEWGEPGTSAAIRQCLAEGLVPPPDLALYMTMLVRFGTWQVAELEPLVPLVGAVHLKFWDLDDADGRVTSPLLQLGRTLAAHEFTGTLCSEWGGHDWYDGSSSPAEITGQHLDVVRRVLGSLSGPVTDLG